MPFITERIRLELGAVVVDNVTGARDRISWGETSDGKFSVKSAYAMLMEDHTCGPNMSSFFNRLWKVVAPERIRMFLWLVSHQVIMTNAERYRRHLGDTSICQVCKGGEETIMHIVRDCPSIAGIWARIVPLRRRNEFFKASLLGWIYQNLGSDDEVDGVPWPTLFAMGVWWSWKWRCGYVFGELGKCRDRVKFVKDLAMEVYSAHGLESRPRERGEMVERMIAWKKPGEGWLKLNTDGASRGNPGLATAGGVLRDASGSWCEGFSLNIGVCSAPLAELWGGFTMVFT